MYRDTESLKNEEVKEFFDKWKTYKKAMDLDYIGHRGAYDTLKKYVNSHYKARPFSIIDFGCGDAEFMSEVLKETTIKGYKGIDLSPVVIKMAKKNMAGIKCSKEFKQADLMDCIGKGTRADIVWTGLSIHHLPLEYKKKFIKKCGQIFSKEKGTLLIHEPLRRERESMKTYLKRLKNLCDKEWDELTTRQKAEFYGHIEATDLPEPLSFYQSIGKEAGFSSVDLLYMDKHDVHGVVVFTMGR
ncbi:MAG TPA: class I SAM-dependent methyltransferase [Candidatus Omnitrophota bacterium]|nr:class I SAM-dependent methyltransferase [Candidatus Omnitrophota bacterium]HPS19368.1 class I SAM-dependent methyltransferase [Candidatus Omnitrophota bacterium]